MPRKKVGMKKIGFYFVLFLCCAVSYGADDKLHARPRYQLHPGDVLSLEYRYTPEFNQSVTVQPDGLIDLNVVGELKVVGLTTTEAHDLIVEKASAQLNHPELNLVLEEFEKPFIVIAGEVDKPGRVDFQEDTTALQAIMQAGGFKNSAQQSQVVLFRRVGNGLAEVHEINLKNIKTKADLKRDMVLQPGDMLLVPRNKLDKMERFIKATNLGVYFDPAALAAFY